MSKEKKEPAEETGFKVSDKRHFTAEGYVLPEQEGPAEKSEEAPESPALLAAPASTRPST